MAEALHTAATAIMLRFVASEPDPIERKARIIIMHQDGHLSDQEAADWIAILDLKAA